MRMQRHVSLGQSLTQRFGGHREPLTALRDTNYLDKLT